MAEETPKWPALIRFLDKRMHLITGVCFAAMLASLRFRFLDPFIVTTWHGKLGVDFFSVPRAFINLLHGKSIYDTWAFDYGPYATWFPYHPATAVLAGSWLSVMSPWAAYCVFVLCSAAILFYCAKLAGGFASGGLPRKALYFMFLCSPPAYLLLWNGQMHVFTVLSVCLIAHALVSELRGGNGVPALASGVLICLLTKPIIIPALPLLFAVKRFRKPLLLSLCAYAAVSALLLFIPALNPKSLGPDALFDALLNPDIIFSKTLDGNILRVHYKTEFLLDNAIHWLNMRNLTGVIRADVFEFLSVSGFFARLFPGISPAAFKLPVLLLGIFSLALFFVRREAAKLRAAVYIFVFAVLSFYLAYDSVYEYHFTTLMALSACLFALYHGDIAGFRNASVRWICAASALFYAPTAYYWAMNPAYGYHGQRTAAWPLYAIRVVLEARPYDWALWQIRISRVIPVLAIFACLSYIIVVELKKGIFDDD